MSALDQLLRDSLSSRLENQSVAELTVTRDAARQDVADLTTAMANYHTKAGETHPIASALREATAHLDKVEAALEQATRLAPSVDLQQLFNIKMAAQTPAAPRTVTTAAPAKKKRGAPRIKPAGAAEAPTRVLFTRTEPPVPLAQVLARLRARGDYDAAYRLQLKSWLDFFLGVYRHFRIAHGRRVIRQRARMKRRRRNFR